MKTLKLPKGYLSPTQLWLWENKRDWYIRKYINGEDIEESNLKMEFGKKFAKSRETDEMLDDENLEMAKILMPTLPIREKEITAFLKLDGGLKVKLLGKPDGFDKKNLDILDDKTGKKWTQKMADQSQQFTFYALLVWLKYKKLPRKIIVNWVEAAEREIEKNGDVYCDIYATGKRQTFISQRKMTDIYSLIGKISKAARDISKLYLAKLEEEKKNRKSKVANKEGVQLSKSFKMNGSKRKFKIEYEIKLK